MLPIFDTWLHYTNQPFVLSLLIVGATYILEDAAIITASLLSAEGIIAPHIAFFSLIFGIITGDLGLYVLGVLLRRTIVPDKWLKKPKMQQAAKWLKRRMITSVLIVRLLPGFRLPMYTTCGLLQLSFWIFFILVFFASIIWTATIFFGIFFLGGILWAKLSEIKWIALPILLVLIFYAHKKISHNILGNFEDGKSKK